MIDLKEYARTPPITREPRYEDATHLAFVRTLPCSVHGCKNPSEAHHLVLKSRGQAASDALAIPLCQIHHTGAHGIHRLGMDGFEDTYALDLNLVLIKTIEARLRECKN